MKKKISLPIGIFDSGIGGLTVAKEIIKLLPFENIIYLGDTARVPYGTKSSKTVIAYSHSNSKFLLSKGIKLLVIACNTASAVALQSLRWDLEVPVIGVLEPGARKAVKTTVNNTVGVIGTPSTIKSNAYKKAIENINPDIKVYSKSCPLFVPLAEEGWTEDLISELIADKYLSQLTKYNIDTLILGCTHYPLLKTIIEKTVGRDVGLIDSAEETAKEVERTLTNSKLINKENSNPHKQYFLTDTSDTFISIAGNFLGEKIKKVEQVDI
jgi:glutamate racemase